MSEADKKAWGDFWAAETANSSGGCLPDGWRKIEAAQRQAWTQFAEELPEGCRVLDLASGDGRLMRWLREARPDLVLVGVDLAPSLPAPPAGTTLHAGVAMEDLPFEDASFGAVVSQFGFEYGDIARVAAEIARVLWPGGIVGILTHRIDGPIMAHNRERRRAIGWIFERKNLFALAHRILAARGAGFVASPVAITQIVNEGAQRFGPQSAAWEIAEAVRRSLMLPPTVKSQDIADLLNRIGEQAQNEIGRIDSLENACRTTDDAAGFAAAVTASGFAIHSVTALFETDGKQPFADFRTLRISR